MKWTKPFLSSLVVFFVVAAMFLRVGSASTVLADERNEEDERPKVGETAPDFELADLQDASHKLSEHIADGPVVLLVIRGYVGYQCSVCSKQVGEYLSEAEAFAEHDAKIVMVYPGPADNLKKYAEDFITGKTLPDNVIFLIDPDYTFTNAYGLRWDEPRQTAHPATFVIEKDSQEVAFAYISGDNHRDRPAVDDVLKALDEME